MNRSLFNALSQIRLLPVVVTEKEEDALPLARALSAGGLPCAEITYRTQAASACLKAISREMPDMLLGAGTVLSCAQVDDAMANGASFIVTPGFNPKVVEYCVDRKIPIIPGINNPTGVEAALSLGLDVVKFFPAEASGGVAMLKAMSAPYTQVRFVPPGGISPANLSPYLALPCVLACGGSWMVKSDWIAQGLFGRIRDVTREAVNLCAR